MRKFLIFTGCFLLLTGGLNAGKLEDNLKKLRSDNSAERRLAARALGSLQDKKAIPEMIKVLKKEKDEEVKIALIDSLGLLKSREAVPLLVKMLKKEEDKVKIRAIVALGRIGDKAAIPELKRLLKNGNPVVKCHSAGALGKMGVKEGLPVLIDILKKYPAARIPAIENLGFFKQKEAAEALIPFLESKDMKIKMLVARALGNVGSEIAAPPLEKILKTEKNEIILKKVVCALGKIGSPGSAELLYTFLKPRRKRDKTLPLEALKSLSSLKNDSGMPYLIKCFKDEEIPNWVRGRSIDIVREKGSEKNREEAVKALLMEKRWSVAWKKSEAKYLEKYISSKDENVRARAYSGLARIDEKKYRTLLLDGLKDESRIVKQMILRRFYESEDRDSLKAALENGDSFVQVMAASGLALLADNSGFDIALQGLESKEPEIREIALEAVENMKDKKAIPHLKKLYKRQKDKEFKKRIKEAIKAIKKAE